MQTPDVTKVQIIAFVGSLLALLTAFGLPLTEGQEQAIIDLVEKTAPLAIAADAVIRFGRSKHLAKPEG